MILSKVTLSNFRNFKKASFSFSPFVTIIIGENARGKTSLLESIHVVIFGRGFRETREEELIQWHQDKGIIEAAFQEENVRHLFQVVFQRQDAQVDKRYLVNKTSKTHAQYATFQTTAVLFAPEHISIVSGSPEDRRHYLDQVLSAADVHYLKHLRNYENALRKRNKVLEHFKNESSLEEELSFWNQYLIEQAAYLTQKREEYLQFLNDHPTIDHRRFQVEYLKNEFTQERLEQFREEEKRWRKTRIGPQKDDILITLHNEEAKNLHLYGSRSEQRLGVFWLKLNEIRFLEKEVKKRPILLLDDVFSELDVKNKKLILDVIKEYQTVITTTEVELLNLISTPHTVIKL